MTTTLIQTPTSQVKLILTWNQMGRRALAAGRTRAVMTKISSLGWPQPNIDQLEIIAWSESGSGFLPIQLFGVVVILVHGSPKCYYYYL